MVIDQRPVRQRDQFKDVPRSIRLLVLLRRFPVHAADDDSMVFGLVEEARVDEEGVAGCNGEGAVGEPDGIYYWVGSEAIVREGKPKSASRLRRDGPGETREAEAEKTRTERCQV
jgi:hypothetical protein